MEITNMNKEKTIVAANKCSAPDPPFICSLCYGKFRNLIVLRRHMIRDHFCLPKDAPDPAVSESESEPDEPSGLKKSRIEVDKNKCNPGKQKKQLHVVNQPNKSTAKIQKNKSNPANEKNKSSNKKDVKNESQKSSDKNKIIKLPAMNFAELKLLMKSELAHKCTIQGCSYKFDSKEKQETHIKCHASSDPDKIKDFKCFDCGLEAKNWRSCSSHMWKDHEIDVDFMSCPLCSYKAETSVKIWRHLKVHKNWSSKVRKFGKNIAEKDKEYPIENKSKYYSQKTCEICNRNFVNGKTLSKHIKAVHNKIKPFICNVCGRTSARKATWLIHMRQHTDEKLKCKYCPFQARDPSVINKHELRHMGKPGQYKCMACSYTSIQTSAFKMHIKYYHPDEYKKIACDQCNFVTITNQKLEAHKKDHEKGLILNEDSMDTVNLAKSQQKHNTPEKALGNVEISSDCFLPLESTDSIADTGGVTIPAHSEDTQFPSFLNI